jgi:hypothetical protein
MPQPTQAQIRTWLSIKDVAKRCDIEIRAMQERFKQVQIYHAFCTSKNLPITFDARALSSEALQVYDRNERLKKAIGAVELEKFGLRFRGNEVDIMAPPGTTGDEIGPYQLTGWPIIIVGVVVVYAVIEIIADQRQRAYDTYRKASNIVEHGDAQLCADPTSQTCADWRAVKAENSFEEQNGNIAGLFDEAKDWPEKVKNWFKAAGSGIAFAAVIVAGYLLWERKKA